ncbi:MAG: vWA domain-containing protein [Thermoguttaceae bacterium]
MYSAEISRSNPTCFLFLVDQSGSMDDPFGGESGKRKSQGVSDAINRLLQTLVFRCAKGDVILDRYYIGVIGYGDQVGPAFGGVLAGQGLVPVSKIGNSPLRLETRTKMVDDGAGGLVEQTVRFPVWFEPRAKGGTPMCQALGLARQTIFAFINQVPACFPPIVINITDGQATDGQPQAAAAAVQELASRDGRTLLFNVHISCRNEKPIQFPNREDLLPDNHAKLLFRMSSQLPPQMLAQAQSMDHRIAVGARGFVFNADLVSVVQFLDIGTRVDRNQR